LVIVVRGDEGAGDRAALRAVALLEAAKGALVVFAGFGLLALIHVDVQDAAERLVSLFHLNPASAYPRIFLQAAGAAGGVSDARLWALAGAAFGYSALRFTEAWGLWREKRWAKWLGVGSCAIYLPIELVELATGVTWPRVSLLVVNLLVVAFLGRSLWAARRRRG